MIDVPVQKIEALISDLRDAGGATCIAIADRLQALVDAEEAAFDEYMTRQYEESEWGRLEMQEAAIEKSLR